ncbi:MAG TPA: hypothetical protein VEW93_01630 [Acidimicrobiales bacterium]|nr:hypothetical protein [Acidimicrobiales bacterium]
MGFLKNVATAFTPSNLKQGLEAARNPPTPEQMEASLAALTPEQRAAYEANMAHVRQAQAESMAAHGQALAIEDQHRVLRGPAGRHLYGASLAEQPSPDEMQRIAAEEGPWALVRQTRAAQKGDFANALNQTFNRDAVPQEDDPAQRVRIQAEERAARAEARAPYRAPHARPVAISRLATRGATQLSEVLAHLGASGLAAHPERVYGLYRVPDRISGPITPHSEQGRVVEWDVVHLPPDAPGPQGVPAAPAAGPPVATSFRAADHWVTRRAGEPAVLDEDLAVAFCLWAGIGPERCLGLARMSEVRALRNGDEDHDHLRPLVRGIVAIHPPEASGMFERLAASAPFAVADPAASGVHVEVLNWGEVARVVHPKIHHPPAVPSPFPYLPSTPQELIRSYLEVVGVGPEDCYSVQATFDRPSSLVPGGLFTTNLGPRQACADGQDRMRTHACEHVVLVYRDRPEHGAGRDRWRAYQEHVLQAHLHKGTGTRAPLHPDDDLSDISSSFLRGAIRVAQAVDWVDTLGDEKLPPYRYCWPLVGGGPS